MEAPKQHLNVQAEPADQLLGLSAGPGRAIYRRCSLICAVTALVLMAVASARFGSAVAPKTAVDNPSTGLQNTFLSGQAFYFAPSLSLRPAIGGGHALIGKKPNGIRFGTRRYRLRLPTLARPMSSSSELPMSNEPSGGSASIGDLLLLPVPKLESTLRSMNSNLVLTASDSAKIIDKACASADLNLFRARRGNLTEGLKLQRTLLSIYSLLEKKGILPGFGSCGNALVPLGNSVNFKEADQQVATGLPPDAWKPPAGKQSLELGGRAAVALALLAAETQLGSQGQDIAEMLLTVLAADTFLFGGSLVDSVVQTVRPSPEFPNIVLEHEAGHLLVAYLLGNPIQGCLLDSQSVRQSGRFGAGTAGGTVFFDPELEELEKKVKNSTEDGLRTCLNRYSIIGMAGIAAEAMSRGQAVGGGTDERLLEVLLSKMTRLGAEGIASQARWGATQAYLLLRDHQSAYTALCEALQRGASTGEAIMAIEGALAKAPELPAEARKRLPKPLGDAALSTPAMPSGKETQQLLENRVQSVASVDQLKSARARMVEELEWLEGERARVNELLENGAGMESAKAVQLVQQKAEYASMVAVAAGKEGHSQKSAWPELMGKSGAAAIQIIGAERPDLSCFEVVQEGAAVTMDYREDRVRVYVHPHGRVARPPRVG